MNTESPIAA